MESYYRYVHLTIHYNDFASTTLFSPYKPAYVNSDIKSRLLLKQDETRASQGIRWGKLWYLGPKPQPHDVLVSSGINFSKHDIDNLDVYLKFLKIRLLGELGLLNSKNLKDDYDKALAIEDYLRKLLIQPLSEPVPEGVDFIDLLNLKKAVYLLCNSYGHHA